MRTIASAGGAPYPGQMAQNPLIKRYLDAGMAFTQMTQARAEAIVKDLVRSGEVQASRTEELVGQLVERSRQNTEKLLDSVRREVRDQVAALGLATQDDIARLERRVAAAEKAPSKAAGTKAAPKKAAAKKAAAKKSGAARKAAKKAAPRRSGS